MHEPSRPPELSDEKEDPLPDGKASALDGLSCGLAGWLRDLAHHFGWKLLVLLFFCQHLTKGFLMALVQQSSTFLFKEYGVDAVQMEIYNGIILMSLAMKPVLGLLSDCVPISGYKRGPYILIVVSLGTFGFTIIGALSGPGFPVSLVVACLFLVNLQAAICDCISEAIYASRLQEKPAHASALVSYVYIGQAITGVLATLASGLMIQNLGPSFSFLVCAPFAASVLVPILRGYTEEPRVTWSQAAEARLRFCEQKEVVAVALLMFLGSVLITLVPTCYSDISVIFAVSSSVALVILAAFTLFTSPIIAKFNAYFLLQTAIVPNIDGAMFYFFTDTPQMYPEGPHYSTFFFTTFLTLVMSAAMLASMVFYNRFGKDLAYRRLMTGLNLFSAVFLLFDVLQISRLNKKLGLPDEVMSLILRTYNGCYQTFLLMPAFIAMSYLCPKGMEATMFAMLASCHNMGNTVSMHAGAFLLSQLGCRPNGEVDESEQFENLWIAGLVRAAMPLGISVCLTWLLPDKSQTVNLLSETDDATSGSLWKRLVKKRDD